jgi:hypothetical protein
MQAETRLLRPLRPTLLYIPAVDNPPAPPSISSFSPLGRESEAKRAMQAETRLFADHMIAQKREVQRQEGVADEARQQAQAHEWGKRMAVWGAEQEAREQLMAQVLDERRIQVRGCELR